MFLLFVPFVWVGLCSEVLGLRVALRCGLCRQFERGRQKRQGEAEREKCAAAQKMMIYLLLDSRFLGDDFLVFWTAVLFVFEVT